MKKTTKIVWFVLVTLVILAAASCGKQLASKLDVVGTESVKSFDKVLQSSVQSVSADEMNGGWSLTAPDGMARFIWSKNYAESPLHGTDTERQSRDGSPLAVMLELDAAPFIAAGLDPEKLPDNFAFYEGMLMVGTKLGEETLRYSGEATPLASYEQIVKLKRSSIGYHGALDHYGVDLGDGNLFHWAKDMTTNDKDIVFGLNPAPFIAAGVDPTNIKGWMLGKVTVDDASGKPIQVDKILKPFNLL